MAADDPPLGDPFRARRGDVRLVEHLSRLRPRHPHVERDEQQRQRQPRQNEVLRPRDDSAAVRVGAAAAEERAVAVRRQQTRALAERPLEHDPDDERMRRDGGEGDEQQGAIEPGSDPRACHRTERQGEHDQEQGRSEYERARHRCGSEQRRRHPVAADDPVRRHLGARPGEPEITADEIRDEAPVLLEERAVDAQGLVRVLDLLRRRVRDPPEQELTGILRDGVGDQERQRGEEEQEPDRRE